MNFGWPLPVFGLGGIAAALLWAQAPQGKAYPLPAAEARAILRATELPDGIYGSQPTPSRAMQLGDGTIVWKLRVGTQEALRYTATVEPVDPSNTRVTVALSAPPEGKAAEKIKESLASHPQIHAFYLKAMEEQVDAALERRPYRWDAVMPAMGAAMIGSMGEISASMDEAAADFKKRDRDNIDRAYHNERFGGGTFGEENIPSDEPENFDSN